MVVVLDIELLLVELSTLPSPSIFRKSKPPAWLVEVVRMNVNAETQSAAAELRTDFFCMRRFCGRLR
jgi:hypothetical protein